MPFAGPQAGHLWVGPWIWGCYPWKWSLSCKCNLVWHWLQSMWTLFLNIRSSKEDFDINVTHLKTCVAWIHQVYLLVCMILPKLDFLDSECLNHNVCEQCLIKSAPILSCHSLIEIIDKLFCHHWNRKGSQSCWKDINKCSCNLDNHSFRQAKYVQYRCLCTMTKLKLANCVS